ncbi:exported hypothetical protein [Verrucomicrobia bacterium]|nr:exported hypothetical protein [Verrucomicrobiota bacterium]
MHLRALRIVLAAVGLALLALGLFHTASDILGSFNSSGSSTSAQAITLYDSRPLVGSGACRWVPGCVKLFCREEESLRDERRIAEQAGCNELRDDASVAFWRSAARAR